MEPSTSRRRFLSRSGRTGVGVTLGATAAGHLLPRRVGAAVLGANEKVVVGVIGSGGMGQRNMRRFLPHKNVEFASLCDVDRTHTEQAAKLVEDTRNQRPALFKDYRKLLENKDIDAVIVATPDHWHALPMIAACEAEKDVYVEKPLSHNIVEGRAMVNVAKRFKRVVQVGTWQRSTRQFIEALEFVKSGKLGKISVCRAWCVSNGGGIGRQKPTTPPAHLDWDFWLGPAEKVPYTPNRCHTTFRWFFNTAGGLIADNGVHMLDIMQVGMGHPQPIGATAVGGNYVLDDDRTTPDTHCVTWQFKDFVATWETRFGNARPLDGARSGYAIEFIGKRGALIVSRGRRIEVFSEGKRLEGRPKLLTDSKDPCSDGRNAHIAEFLECIKTRKTPRSDVETVHRSTTLCHLGNMAYLLKRSVQWDPIKEEPINDPEAKNCLLYQREYRKPWSLPMHTV